MPFVHVILLL